MKLDGTAGKAVFSFIAMILLTVVGAQPAWAEEKVDCDNDFGTELPILPVHGFNGSSNDWDGFKAEVDVDGTQFVTPFNYGEAAREWVTDPKIGLALANTIDCLAQASLKNGGKGKVGAVGYSMGGSALSYASNQVIDGRKVSDELGLVIPIGAPFEGADMASHCQFIASWTSFCEGSAPEAMAPGSKELKELPRFPDNVPVRAIGGNVELYYDYYFTSFYVDLKSDKVVSTESATAFGTETGVGDGKIVHKCSGVSPFLFGDADCEHTSMLSSKGIRSEVVKGFQDYVKSLERTELPPHHDVELFGKMTVPYLDAWDEVMSESSSELLMDARDCHSESANCPMIEFYNLDAQENRGLELAEEAKLHVCDETQKPAHQKEYEFVETTTVDGQKVDQYQQLVCSPDINPQIKHYAWLSKDQGVLILANDTQGGSLRLQEMQAVVQAISWS